MTRVILKRGIEDNLKKQINTFYIFLTNPLFSYILWVLLVRLTASSFFLEKPAKTGSLHNLIANNTQYICLI